LPIIISILNHKGGVGKTTLAHNISAGLAKLEKNTLLIDLDLQSNLTISVLGLNDNRKNISDLFVGEEVNINNLIYNTDDKYLSIVPSSEMMALAEPSLNNRIGKEFVLRNAIKTPNIDKYDFVIIDCPPHLSTITLNALFASDFYIVPLRTDVFSIHGFKILNTVVTDVNKIFINTLNAKKIELLGYIVNAYDSRTSMAIDTVNLLKDMYKEKVFNTNIRVNANFSRCPALKQSIFDIERNGKGSEDILLLINEIFTRIENNGK